MMGLLYKHRDVSFTRVRDLLHLTDGNLASHAAKLAEAGYLEGRRVLTREGFEMRYRITSQGAEAFHAYLAWLRSVLRELERETSGGAAEDLTPTGEA